jgi:hypothetical protein
MRSHRYTVALLALLFSATANLAKAQSDCTDVRGTESVIHGHRIVMIGEIHGTKEMPAMFTRLVCAALRRGNVVAVGLEMWPNQRDPLDAYMASDGGETARKTLLASAFWTAQFQDGRRSVAHLDMIEALRAMRRQGMALTVFVLEEQSGTTPPSRSRDGVMAANVRRQYEAHPATLVLTFTGNIHNMLKIPDHLKSIPAPMGVELRDLNPVSINLVSAGGTEWNCRPDCGVQRTTALGPAASSIGEPVLTLGANEGEYSGHINIGPTTASLPAATAGE